MALPGQLLRSQFVGGEDTENEERNEDSHEDKEQHLCNVGSAFSYTAKAKQGGDDRNDKENGGPTKHASLYRSPDIDGYQSTKQRDVARPIPILSAASRFNLEPLPLGVG
jgi:hypothetical protein